MSLLCQCELATSFCKLFQILSIRFIGRFLVNMLFIDMCFQMFLKSKILMSQKTKDQNATYIACGSFGKDK